MTFELFLNLPETQQERILSASLREFAERGYENASTNRIVKDAGISKGVLFKYFGTKESLFVYVWKQYMNRLLAQIHTEDLQGDLFEKMYAIIRQEILLFHSNTDMRYVYLLYRKMLTDYHLPAYQAALENQNESFEHYLDKMTGELDPSLLREEITTEHVYTAATFLSSWMRMALIHESSTYEAAEKLIEDMKKMIQIIRLGIYKT